MTFIASNMTLTCIHAGADTADADDTYARVHNKYADLSFLPSHGVAREQGMNSGDFGYLAGSEFNGQIQSSFPIPGPGVPGTTGRIGQTSENFSNSINFRVFDDDSRDPFGGADDLINDTTYVATGNEPLVGQGAFHFVNVMTRNGSTYKLEYDINKLPGGTTGKIASKEGGVLNGKNIDGTLIGLNGKDIINANGGDDILVGGGNDDVLNGGTGDDLIFGGKGNDTLSGGAGSDIFVMARGFGVDTIKDFNFRTNGDLIGLGKGLTFEDLSFKKIGSSTQISVGNDPLALLQGVKPGQLTAANFTQFDLGSLNTRVKTDMAALGAA